MNLKRLISLLLVLVMLTLACTSCDISEIISSITGQTGTTATPTTAPSTPVEPKPDGPGSVDPEPNDPEDQNSWEELYDVITVEEALKIAEGAAEPTSERYYVMGVITNVSNPAYGEMYISDGTGEIYVYGVTGYSTMEEKPVKGDTVLLHCTLQNYKGTLEVQNANLIDFKPADKGDIDVSEYKEMSVADARNAEVGTKISITGIVAQITYANGRVPSGVYIVDGTSSIYVYDGDVAAQVEIGNKITVLGSKTYWVLESEIENAKKHGYNGCCQLDDAILYDNDKDIHTVDFSFCEEITVKELINTPVSENITTQVYKTTALVKKVPGSDFVNYYFFDIDGETGSYTYTQCSGADFAWLDEYDGKICTVYISAINAKSTSSDCFFRLLPVAVVDEGFTFDLSKAPEYVLEYHAVDLFLSKYTGNPLLEVPTSVDNELLGISGANVSYTSSNESVAYFEQVDEKLIFNCASNGTATITVTATYGEYSASRELTVTVDSYADIEAYTVLGVIETAVGETVTVKGIVGPSAVNQSAFYLIDETGAIPVLIDASSFKGLAVGQTVIVEGVRTVTKEGGGQICISDAKIISNEYGKTDYSTKSFITGKTLADLVAIADSAEETTKVYVVNATVNVMDYGFYTIINLTSGDSTLSLYCSGANQYSWLFDYSGKEVTMELSLCDWNAKGLKGCVLSIITEDGKIYNEFNFEK